MNRFVGSSPDERKGLVLDAIEAHRDRKSGHLTLEAERETADGEDASGPPPWVQYRERDSHLNLDCTAEELPSIERAVGTLGGVTITDRTAIPEAGTNLRLTVNGDDERVAMVIETLFLDGFECEADVSVWAAEI